MMAQGGYVAPPATALRLYRISTGFSLAVLVFLLIAVAVQDWRAWHAEKADFTWLDFNAMQNWPDDYAIRVGAFSAYDRACKDGDSLDRDRKKIDCKTIVMSDFYDNYFIDPYKNWQGDAKSMSDDAKAERSSNSVCAAFSLISLLVFCPLVLICLLVSLRKLSFESPSRRFGLWFFVVGIGHAVCLLFLFIAWVVVVGTKMGSYKINNGVFYVTIDVSKGRDDGISLGAAIFSWCLEWLAVAFLFLGTRAAASGESGDHVPVMKEGDAAAAPASGADQSAAADYGTRSV